MNKPPCFRKCSSFQGVRQHIFKKLSRFGKLFYIVAKNLQQPRRYADGSTYRNVQLKPKKINKMDKLFLKKAIAYFLVLSMLNSCAFFVATLNKSSYTTMPPLSALIIIPMIHSCVYYFLLIILKSNI